MPPTAHGFASPVLGWDATTGREVRWHPAGAQQSLNNGHIEIWGSSGMGKTQFAMSLLGQLSRHTGSRFGIADFKNDYSADTGFPASLPPTSWTFGTPVRRTTLWPSRTIARAPSILP